MSLDMFAKYDILQGNHQFLRQKCVDISQASLLVNNGLNPGKVAEDFSIGCSKFCLWIKLSE